MKKLLLASSSKSFLQRNKNLLNREGFHLFLAHNGAEALQLHQEHSFDLVFADMQLQDMGGDALCSQLRSAGDSKKTAILLVCYDNPDEHARVAQCGADAKIIRPIQPDQVIETVGGLLGMQLVRTKRVIFKVRVLSRKGAKEFYCVSLDISITGILLETEHHLDIGDRIICQFTLPGINQIESEGDVVRSVKMQAGVHQYGVQFVALPLSSRRDIERYIASARANAVSG